MLGLLWVLSLGQGSGENTLTRIRALIAALTRLGFIAKAYTRKSTIKILWFVFSSDSVIRKELVDHSRED